MVGVKQGHAELAFSGWAGKTRNWDLIETVNLNPDKQKKAA